MLTGEAYRQRMPLTLALYARARPVSIAAVSTAYARMHTLPGLMVVRSTGPAFRHAADKMDDDEKDRRCFLWPRQAAVLPSTTRCAP